MTADRDGDPTTPRSLAGKHWHPSLGWTNHGEQACRQAVRESEPLNDLKAILARRREQLSKAG